jgi:RNA polymerase sigma-70 factor (ECF subfamily)
MSVDEAESDLIDLAIGGDAVALERLLFRHYDRLLRRIGRKLPTALGPAVQAEDVLQQVLLEAFVRIRQLEARGPRAFYRWLVTIADHEVLDVVRAGKAVKRGGGRVAVGPGDAAGSSFSRDLIDVLMSPSNTPSQSVARREGIAAIRIGLASLEPDYRQAIELRYLQGWSAEETAKAMGRSPHAVHHLCSRGLKELHAVLGRSSQYLTRR